MERGATVVSRVRKVRGGEGREGVEAKVEFRRQRTETDC